jgi:hypothetical protein
MDKPIPNWSCLDIAFVGIDIIVDEGRYFPHVCLIVDDEKETGDRGVIVMTANSFATLAHACWDTRVNLENLGFHVAREVTVFDSNGDEIDTYIFEEPVKERETLQ